MEIFEFPSREKRARLIGENDRIDDMNDTVATHDIGFDNLSIINHHTISGFINGQVLSISGLGSADHHNIFCQYLSGYHMIGQN